VVAVVPTVGVELIRERAGPLDTGRVDVDATFGAVRPRLVRIASGLVDLADRARAVR
jgi:hypothetical protein